MQNNFNGHRNRADPKTALVHDKPSCRGLRAKIHPVDEAISDGIIKSLTSGIVTDCLELNVYKEPSVYAEVLAAIDALSEVMVNMDTSSDGFYKICTENGVEGFCVKKYIALRR